MRLRMVLNVAGAAVFAAAAVLLWPQARHAAALFAAQDDPARLSDLKLAATGMVVSPVDVAAALAEDDVDLARSLVALAAARNEILPPETLAAVEAAERDSARRMAVQFVDGFVTGRVSGGASLTGTIAGDLFVYGDIRDLVREGHHLATGDEVDTVLMGLAGAGIAATAATFMSVGTAAPVRAGLTLMKDARRAGRIGGELAAWTGRSARALVDTPALKRAVASASVTKPATSVRAIRASLRLDKAEGLFTAAKDINRVRGAAGTRAAFDIMKVADNPADLARAARLAESKGSQTRAIVKLLGRGALVIGAAAWQAASWLFWLVLVLVGFAASVKSSTERMTQGYCDRRRRRLAKAKALATAVA